MTKNAAIIGLSAYYHDAACCLLQDGLLTCAVQEERLSRRKHEPDLPHRAFRYCLERGGITIADLDCLAYYESPVKKLERQLWQFADVLTRERMLRLWQGVRRPEAEIRNGLGYDGPIEYVEHHEAHAASAFYYSGFLEAAILTVDGVGEWATMTYGRGGGDTFELFEEVRFPNSLGLLYSAITDYLGFSVNDGEYKVMGLAPYGTPRYTELFGKVVTAGDGGQVGLAHEYFDFTRGDRMFSDRLIELLGRPARKKGEPILPFHQDLARSVQVVLEDLLLAKVRYLYDRVPADALCLAGGVALNCVANGRILREGPFAKVFVQPAAGDAGGSLGAAALVHARRAGAAPRVRLKDAFLGPEYSGDEIRRTLDATGLRYGDYRHDEAALISDAVDRLSHGQVVAWFQGRMEFGPRALGARSILADPRDPNMRDRLNLMVKKRERFRPFAPAVLESYAQEHFTIQGSSPFMLFTYQTISPLDLPAITHVDGSARVQTVEPSTAPRFAALLDTFRSRTSCPILLNTSFNIADEPIVCSPLDALVSFARSELNALFLGDFVIDRADLVPEFLAACQEDEQPRPAISDHIYTFS